ADDVDGVIESVLRLRLPDAGAEVGSLAVRVLVDGPHPNARGRQRLYFCALDNLPAVPPAGVVAPDRGNAGLLQARDMTGCILRCINSPKRHCVPPLEN